MTYLWVSPSLNRYTCPITIKHLPVAIYGSLWLYSVIWCQTLLDSVSTHWSVWICDGVVLSLSLICSFCCMCDPWSQFCYIWLDLHMLRWREISLPACDPNWKWRLNLSKAKKSYLAFLEMSDKSFPVPLLHSPLAFQVKCDPLATSFSVSLPRGSDPNFVWYLSILKAIN